MSVFHWLIYLFPKIISQCCFGSTPSALHLSSIFRRCYGNASTRKRLNTESDQKKRKPPQNEFFWGVSSFFKNYRKSLKNNFLRDFSFLLIRFPDFWVGFRFIWVLYFWGISQYFRSVSSFFRLGGRALRLAQARGPSAEASTG